MILSHNNKIMKEHLRRDTENNEGVSNCRDRCPFDGKCNIGPMVYKAKLTEGRDTRTYIGSTNDFKKRLANHKQSFRNESLKTATTLSNMSGTINRDLARTLTGLS